MEADSDGTAILETFTRGLSHGGPSIPPALLPVRAQAKSSFRLFFSKGFAGVVVLLCVCLCVCVCVYVFVLFSNRFAALQGCV